MGWEARAACHGGVAALFFTTEGEHGRKRELREWAARAICAGYPAVPGIDHERGNPIRTVGRAHRGRESQGAQKPCQAT